MVAQTWIKQQEIEIKTQKSAESIMFNFQCRLAPSSLADMFVADAFSNVRSRYNKLLAQIPAPLWN